MQEEILKIWKNKSSDFLWIFNWITKVDTTIFKFARNLLKLKFTSKAYIFATNWFSIARYKNIPSELLSSHKEFNTWEMYALNQFVKFRIQPVKFSDKYKFMCAGPARSFSSLTFFSFNYSSSFFFYVSLTLLLFSYFSLGHNISTYFPSFTLHSFTYLHISLLPGR